MIREKKRDCQLSFSAPADGRYDLLIRDLHRDMVAHGTSTVFRQEGRQQIFN